MYQAGIYCRISIEEQKKEGEYSNSIRSQIQMARDYIADHGDIVEVKVYADDGASGSNFDRTEFRRMLADIELGVINMVILKDVSRLGREHIDTNYYLGKYFPEKRIRVVSLLDHYDSSVAAYDELLEIKTLLNDMYLRDTSKKSRPHDRIHTAGQLRQGQTETVEMSIGTYETTLNLQLWKAYADEIEISIETPSGERLPTLSEKIGTQRYRAGETDLLIYYGKPGPFQVTQEIYFDFIPVETYLTSGIWKIHLHGRRIREGNYNLWLPGGNVLNPVTGFYRPIAAETLTIPSTAAKVITVGAYDSRLNAYADFSGRGGSNLSFPKPDLVAPGVNITAPTPGGAYTSVTGTSFSTPFVTGSAALLMEWGIIQRNDPFLWGEKVKAYLRRGAQPLPGFNEYPNEAVGWGRFVQHKVFHYS